MTPREHVQQLSTGLNDDQIAAVEQHIITITQEEDPVLRIRHLARDPSSSSIKKLKTPADTWRLRVGSWRIFFEFNQADHIVKILKISDRKDAY